MKLGLRNYAVIMPMKTDVSNLVTIRYIVQKGMAMHKITGFYTKWFSVFPNITSKFRTNAIFKSSANENNGSNKTCRYVHDLSLYKT
jgi:hypothetical protein